MTDLKDDAWHWVEGWLGEQLSAEVPRSPCEGQFDAYVAGATRMVELLLESVDKTLVNAFGNTRTELENIRHDIQSYLESLER